jgi:protocatechuate 3,4-dioxygenase beta subunit
MQLVGRVVDTRCRPIPGAVLDFWQADPAGAYDNAGFRLRGHQFSDTEGLYSLETVVPGPYVDGWVRRTPHLHVKVKGPAAPLLTTQLYFPEFAAQNGDDLFYHPELVMAAVDAPSDAGLVLHFDFVLSRSPAA